jgi:hypothetical protein
MPRQRIPKRQPYQRLKLDITINELLTNPRYVRIETLRGHEHIKPGYFFDTKRRKIISTLKKSILEMSTQYDMEGIPHVQLRARYVSYYPVQIAKLAELSVNADSVEAASSGLPDCPRNPAHV